MYELDIDDNEVFTLPIAHTTATAYTPMATKATSTNNTLGVSRTTAGTITTRTTGVNNLEGYLWTFGQV